MEDVVNKVGSIFVQAAADAAFDEVRLSESEKIDNAIKAVKDILDKAHTGVLVHREVKPLNDILLNFCRENAMLLIQKNVKKYERFINATTPITGRYVVYAQNPYADKSDDYIKTDIKFTILIIYFATITEEGVKIAVTKALKGIFGGLKDVKSTQHSK